MEEKKWFAILMRDHCEKKVMKSLFKKGIEFYFPLCPLKKDSLKRQNDQIEQALLPSTLFVHIPEWQILEVGRTKDVISFLHWLNRPAVINDEDILSIVTFLKTYDEVWLEKSVFDPSPKKEILQAESDDQGKTIKAPLRTLGYSLVASISSYKILNPVSRPEKNLQKTKQYSFGLE